MAGYALRLNGRAVSATRGIRRSLRVVPFTAERMKAALATDRKVTAAIG
jgi:hypothetical protein